MLQETQTFLVPLLSTCFFRCLPGFFPPFGFYLDFFAQGGMVAENSFYFKKLAGVCSRFSVSLKPKVCPVLTNIALGVVSFFCWHFSFQELPARRGWGVAGVIGVRSCAGALGFCCFFFRASAYSQVSGERVLKSSSVPLGGSQSRISLLLPEVRCN